MIVCVLSDLTCLPSLLVIESHGILLSRVAKFIQLSCEQLTIANYNGVLISCNNFNV